MHRTVHHDPTSARPDCGQASHFNRRTLVRSAVACGAMGWLTPVGRLLARQAEREGHPERARSVIVLWLQGGPSQLETFDPHPGKEISRGTKAIKTSRPGVLLAEGFEQLADLMDSVSLVRSVVSKEGDHERATYNLKTGFRPDQTLVHPSIGAVLCHQTSDDLDIPRHVSVYPGQWPARGGYLGDRFDAFKLYDPRKRVNDITARVDQQRFERRLDDLIDVVESEFARGRLKDLGSRKTLHRENLLKAKRMMSSEQLAAFDITAAPESLRREYGDTDFGRGCLAAARMIEAGVRCVEVTLNGWDSHRNNHEIQRANVDVLDPAISALIRDLRRRGLLDRTIVVCGGEFGRSPGINPFGGREHWPHGFSIALAGGGIRGGQVIGETSPDPAPRDTDPAKRVVDPRPVEDVHATILHALGIDFHQELMTPVNRPMILSQGQVIRELVS